MREGDAAGLELAEDDPTADFVGQRRLDAAMQRIHPPLKLRARMPAADDLFALFVKLHAEAPFAVRVTTETSVSLHAPPRIDNLLHVLESLVIRPAPARNPAAGKRPAHRTNEDTNNTRISQQPPYPANRSVYGTDRQSLGTDPAEHRFQPLQIEQRRRGHPHAAGQEKTDRRDRFFQMTPTADGQNGRSSGSSAGGAGCGAG